MSFNINHFRSEIDVKQVNFTGRIIHREMRLSDTCGQLLPGNNVFVPHFGALEESTVHLMELGYGYLGNNTLFICVQDLHSPNTLDVYVDLSTAPYKDGLLPGNIHRPLHGIPLRAYCVKSEGDILAPKKIGKEVNIASK